MFQCVPQISPKLCAQLPFVGSRVVRLTACWLAYAAPLHSAHAQSAQGVCDLAVRLVAPSASSGGGDVQMSSFVEDANEQLSALPYEEYKPLAMNEARVARGEVAKFLLEAPGAPAYEVHVTPKKIGNNRVCLRVDWRTKSGRKIVATRINVDNGENVVLGTDEQEHGPMVVLVKPMCR